MDITFLCVYMNAPLSVCLSVSLGVNRSNFSTTSLIFHKFAMNFLPLDDTPTLYCLLSFLQPVVLSSDLAGLRIFEMGVTLTCFTVVASLRSSLVLMLVTVHRLHPQHSLYVSVVRRVVPTLTHFPYVSDLAIFMHKLMVMNVRYVY